jgi:allophanate hydrolase
MSLDAARESNTAASSVPAPGTTGTTGTTPVAGPTVAGLREAYRSGARLTDIVEQTLARIAERAGDHAWISVFPPEKLIDDARRLERRAQVAGGVDRLPLFGIPVGVKDNIDVVGLPTTNACPDFAYRPERSATVITRLERAGAIIIGKTNLDQFATGLVGARSPYGACESIFGGGMISGGSSSGSALAVASGVVPVAVATDTAGSGRVPAALNGVIGFKPTLGMLSTAGLVPACRSIDCITVMSRTVADALGVLQVCGGPDPEHPWTRTDASFEALPAPPTGTVRLGLPDRDQLEFFGDRSMRAGHLDARDRTVAVLDATTTRVDLTPFTDAGELLYNGPWVAERFADLGPFITAHPDAVLPVVRQIIVGGGDGYRAADLFRAQHRLKDLRHAVQRVWRDVDALLLPTIGTTWTHEQVTAEPITRNAALGRYTQFANLLNLAAISVPAGLTSDGRPVAVMLVGPARSDLVLAGIAARLLGEVSESLPRPFVRHAPSPTTH